MDAETFLGFLAAVLTTVAFVPQVYKIIKTNNTKDISLGMYVVFVLGITCWLVYAVMINNLPMLIANSLTLLLSGIVLILKIKNG